MSKGILIYNKKDYEINKWFAENLIKKAKEQGIELQLKFTEDLILPINHVKIFNLEEFKDILFVINRTRNHILSKYFELQKIKVFNNSEVTNIANDKIKTHLFMNDGKIKSIDTFFSTRNIGIQQLINQIGFPLVIKSPRGHGGDQVYLVKTENYLRKILETIEEDMVLIQKLSKNYGKDLRVYIINNKIVGSVIRRSKNDFRANITLGGTSERYDLNKPELNMINNILDKIYIDFGGIDFIFDENDKLLFNEIEDVVGTRSFYNNYQEDICELFIEHVKNTLPQTEE